MKKYIEKIKAYYRNYNKRNYMDAIDDVIKIIDDDKEILQLRKLEIL